MSKNVFKNHSTLFFSHDQEWVAALPDIPDEVEGGQGAGGQDLGLPQEADNLRLGAEGEHFFNILKIFASVYFFVVTGKLYSYNI